MITPWGFDTRLHYNCKVFAGVFELSVKHGYDSFAFVKELMTSEKFYWVFVTDDCQDWCDDAFLFSRIDYQMKCKQGKTLDPYLMWWAGYLYKYWMNTRKMDRKEVYRILPLKKLVNGFAFYHTQDWDFVIDEVTRQKTQVKQKIT